MTQEMSHTNLNDLWNQTTANLKTETSLQDSIIELFDTLSVVNKTEDTTTPTDSKNKITTYSSSGNKILSQYEVDALLRGLSCSYDNNDSKEKYIDFDFRAGTRIIRGRMPVLEIINDRFARIITTELTNFFNTHIEFNPICIDMTNFGDFMRSLPVPTVIDINESNKLPKNFIMVADSRFIFSLVESSFSRPPQQPKIEGREFTKIEMVVINRLMNIVRESLDSAWSEVIDVKTHHIRTEINPQFAAIVPPSDAVVVVTFEVEFDYSIGSFTLCYPLEFLAPIKEKLQSSFICESLKQNSIVKNNILPNILKLENELSFHVDCNSITYDQLRNLKKNDVLFIPQIKKTYNEAIGVRGMVNGKLKFFATLFADTKNNFKITDIITQKNLVLSQKIDMIFFKNFYKNILTNLITNTKKIYYNLKYKLLIQVLKKTYFSALNNINPRFVAQYLKNEHPQTIAVILFFLTDSTAGKILENLPGGVRAEVLMRIYRIDIKSTDILQDVDILITKNIRNIKNIKNFTPSDKKARNIFNNVTNNAIQDELIFEINEDSVQISNDLSKDKLTNLEKK